jgi:hypothetical protein
MQQQQRQLVVVVLLAQGLRPRPMVVPTLLLLLLRQPTADGQRRQARLLVAGCCSTLLRSLRAIAAAGWCAQQQRHARRAAVRPAAAGHALQQRLCDAGDQGHVVTAQCVSAHGHALGAESTARAWSMSLHTCECRRARRSIVLTVCCVLQLMWQVCLLGCCASWQQASRAGDTTRHVVCD